MFAGCESLVDIKLPSALKIIGDNAFDGCHSLKEIVIPEGVTEIGDFAFFHCKSLLKVDLGNIKKIGKRAFVGVPLSEIILPDDIELCRPEDNNLPLTFSLTTNTRTVSLPASVINEYMKYPTGFWSVFDSSDIPSLPYQNDPTEDYVDYTKIDIVLREGVTSVPREFLFNAGTLEFKSISFPNSVKLLGEGAFGFIGFETINIPVGMTVENSTFYATCADIINYGGKKSEWEEFVKYIKEVGWNNGFTEAKIICTDGTIEPTRERPTKPQR